MRDAPEKGAKVGLAAKLAVVKKDAKVELAAKVAVVMSQGAFVLAVAFLAESCSIKTPARGSKLCTCPADGGPPPDHCGLFVCDRTGGHTQRHQGGSQKREGRRGKKRQSRVARRSNDGDQRRRLRALPAGADELRAPPTMPR